MSSINKKSDLSRLFGLIENSLSIDTKDIKKVTDFFSLTDDKSANFRDDRGQINRQAQLNNQSQNTYKEKKLAEPKADNDERKQSIIEKTSLNEKRSELKREVSRGRLQEAIVWSEILGQPISKRRYRRVGRYKYKL